MREYLLFRIYAPLAAWGDIAVGEVRPSYSHPTRSALLGLLAAACGIERADDAQHAALAAACRFAVRVDNPGQFLRDYHTVQPPKTEKRPFFTRRDELLAVREQDADAIQTVRDYYMDALYTVCVWLADDVPHPCSLAQLAQRLAAPVFTLYAGRKSCPLAAPLEAQLVGADSIKAAFDAARWHSPAVPEPVAAPAVFYDECSHAGFDGYEVQKVPRRDAPASRARWQFNQRLEVHARPPAASTETRS